MPGQSASGVGGHGDITEDYTRESTEDGKPRRLHFSYFATSCLSAISLRNGHKSNLIKDIDFKTRGNILEKAVRDSQESGIKFCL